VNAKILSLRERVSLPMVVWLVVLWLLLWGDVSWANIISGTLLAVLITIVLPLPMVSFGIRIRPLRILALLGRFVVDLFAASAQVAWLAVRPGRQPRNSVIGVPLHSGSDLFVSMTAELVSLVPGSVIVEIGAPSARGGQGSLYVHAIGADTEEKRQKVRRDILLTERRILKTFATPQGYAEYLDRCRADGSESLCEGGRW
jgi:multicomponent Na+:H+ antiporter subunit E